MRADHVLTFMDREVQNIARRLSVFGNQSETKEEKMVLIFQQFGFFSTLFIIFKPADSCETLFLYL